MRGAVRVAAVALASFLLSACRTPGLEGSLPEAARSTDPRSVAHAAEASSAEPYPGARSYSGTYSCEGCIERRLTVTIFADGSYRLREVPAVGLAIHEQGRWSASSADPDRIVLESSQGMRVLRRSAPDELTLVDPEGRELHGLIGGVLARLPEVDPLRFSERFVGMYRRAGVQRALVDCATGATLPVIESGDSRNSPQSALDAAWAELAPRDDETVLVVVRAHRVALPLRDAGTGGEAIVVDAFERATRNGRCDELPAPGR